MELCAYDGVVCSTFFSPGERECLDALLENRNKVIWVLPMGMPEHIPVKWADAFIEVRALWVSAFPDEQNDAGRSCCERANRWVEYLVQLGV